MTDEMLSPEITRMGLLSMQVCVPENYTDEEVEKFANKLNPAGTEFGWHIRRQGDEALRDAAERVSCDIRKGCVHIMLDC